MRRRAVVTVPWWLVLLVSPVYLIGAMLWAIAALAVIVVRIIREHRRLT